MVERQKKQRQPSKHVDPEYLGVPEAADKFRISPWTVRKLAYDGKVKAKKFSANKLHIEVASLRAYFEALPDVARPQGEAAHG